MNAYRFHAWRLIIIIIAIKHYIKIMYGSYRIKTKLNFKNN